MIPGTTIDGLLSEGKERWQDIFDADAMRMQVMLICPRKERKILEIQLSDSQSSGRALFSLSAPANLSLTFVHKD